MLQLGGAVPPGMVRDMTEGIIGNTPCLKGRGGVTEEGAVRFLEMIQSRWARAWF